MNLSKPSILLVDDQIENLLLLNGILSKQGYNVHAVKSGKEAFERINVSVPDLILLDIMMPEMDGYEIFQKIKANELTKDVAIIFISALCNTREILYGLELGALDYISKPFNNKEVVARVKNYIQMIQLKKIQEFQNISLISEIKKRQFAEREILNANHQLELLNTRLNDIREEERATIAREINDELGQSLTALKIDLAWTKDNTTGTTDITNKIDTMIETVSDVIKKIQRISTDLRPSILDDLGLVPAIEWYSGEFQNRTGINCHLNLEYIQSADINKNLCVFRVLQEGFTNVARHADAKNIFVKLHSINDYIHLEISDDGNGIKTESINSKNSLGLIGIRERIKHFNGTFEIAAKADQGTKLSIELPIN
ncbi:MAG: response regulator [Candidatus Kapabacteria bacterium]|nr:response regulator [Candidatus Kapabacteria bacterium]